MTIVRRQLTVSASDCCGRGDVISNNKKWLHFPQSQAMQESSRKQKIPRGWQTQSVLVGLLVSRGIAVYLRICSGCVCRIARRCGMRPVERRASVCVCVRVCVCVCECACVLAQELAGACALDHGTRGHVACRRRRKTQ